MNGQQLTISHQKSFFSFEHVRRREIFNLITVELERDTVANVKETSKSDRALQPMKMCTSYRNLTKKSLNFVFSEIRGGNRKENLREKSKTECKCSKTKRFSINQYNLLYFYLTILFQPFRNVLILRKPTRWHFEMLKHPGWTADQLESYLIEKGENGSDIRKAGQFQYDAALHILDKFR